MLSGRKNCRTQKNEAAHVQAKRGKWCLKDSIALDDAKELSVADKYLRLFDKGVLYAEHFVDRQKDLEILGSSLLP